MSAPGRRLIVNADDFGLSPGVNRGICEAFRDGVLTSTTMLVNLEHFEDAVERARVHAGLGVGVHLTLLWGRPVSDPSRVPSLVGPQGAFPRSLATLVRRYVRGALVREEVTREFRAQLRRFVYAGLVPSHLDTHKHIHCLPGVLEALATVAGEFGVDRLRLPRPGRLQGPGPRWPWRARARALLPLLVARRTRRTLASHGLRTTDHFLGIEQQGVLNESALCHIFHGVPEGTTELMCHPGYPDDAANRWSSQPPPRQTELRALTSARVLEAARDSGVERISYREL